MAALGPDFEALLTLAKQAEAERDRWSAVLRSLEHRMLRMIEEAKQDA